MSDPATQYSGSASHHPTQSHLFQTPALHSATAIGAPAQTAMAWALFQGMYRRIKQVAILGLLAATAAASAVWFLLPPPKPSASAKLYVPLNPPAVIGQHPDPPLDRRTQAALVKSRLVLAAAVRPKEVNSLPVVRKQAAQGIDPVDWLAKEVVADFSEGQEILRISLACEDGEQARILVNAITDAYFKEIINKSLTERKERLSKIDEMARRAKADLDRLQKQARDLATPVGSTDAKSLELQRAMLNDQLQDAWKELRKIRFDLQKLKLEESALKNAAAGKPVDLPGPVMDDLVNANERVQASLEQKAVLERQLQNMRKNLKDADNQPHYRQAKTKLDEYEKAHQTLVAQVRVQIEDDIRKKAAADSAAQLAAIQQQINFYPEWEKVLADNVDRLRDSLAKLNTTTLDLEPYRLDIKQAENLYERLKQTATALELEQEAPPRVLALEKAAIAKVDETKRKMIFSALAALAALAGVGGLIGFLEVRLRRVESSDCVTQNLGLPVVGVIPRIPSRWHRGYGKVQETNWQAGLTEAINCTRTVLLHGEGFPDLRVIQITSPVSGEGKTTISSHLALSLALAGRRTLLIDADLRNPNAHKLFAIPNGPGMCEILRGEASLAEAIQPTALASLSMISAGQWTDGTHQALASGGLEDVFAQLRTQFDIIVVDSSPILPITDPLLIARNADGVIVALMQGVSRMPLANEAYRRLSVLGVRVLGAVVSGTPQRTYYGYGYNYASPVSA